MIGLVLTILSAGFAGFYARRAWVAWVIALGITTVIALFLHGWLWGQDWATYTESRVIVSPDGKPLALDLRYLYGLYSFGYMVEFLYAVLGVPGARWLRFLFARQRAVNRAGGVV
jgi:hypothetical protein